MKTNKDLIFVMCITFWFTSNICSFIYFGSTGVMVSNFSYIIILSMLVLFKMNNKRFNNWLETKIKNNK